MIRNLSQTKRVGMGIIGASVIFAMVIIWSGNSNTPTSDPIVTDPSKADPTIVSVKQQSPLSSVENHVSEAVSQTSQGNPLTEEEVDRLANWYRERGATDDFRKLADGSIVGGDAYSGYRSTDDATLAMFAKQGDPYAAQMLGERFAERYRNSHQNDDLKEAKRLLLEASTHGFTTSLAKLFELQIDVAENIGVELGRGISRIDKEALLEAYQYLYVLERRGDLSIDAHKATADAVAQNIGNLKADENTLARKHANDLYQSMVELRQNLGLPPFEDGIPADIRDIVERAINQTMDGSK